MAVHLGGGHAAGRRRGRSGTGGVIFVDGDGFSRSALVCCVRPELPRFCRKLYTGVAARGTSIICFRAEL